MEKQRRWIYKLLPRAFLPKPIEEDLTAAATGPVQPVIVKGAGPLDDKQQGRAGDAMMDLFKILVSPRIAFWQRIRLYSIIALRERVFQKLHCIPRNIRKTQLYNRQKRSTM